MSKSPMSASPIAVPLERYLSYQEVNITMMIIIPSLMALCLASAAPKNSPKVLSLPMVKTVKTIDNTVTRTRVLNSYPQGPLGNERTWYSIELEFGSQKTTIEIDIDTGSADLVISKQRFDPTKSTTFKNSTTPFTDCYVSGDCFNGFVGNDTLWFDGFEIDDVPIYVVENADNVGLLGMGWTNYDNFPFLIRNQGLIDHVAYSIWLNGESESNGEIIFGGIDATKFSGNIGLVRNFGDMTVNSDGSQSFTERPTSFSAALSGLRLKDSTGQVQPIVEGLSYPVIFDTGTTTAGLYKDWIEALGAPLGAKWDDTINGAATTNIPTNGSLVFDFSGVEVELALKDLFPRATTSSGDYSIDGKPAYWFSFVDSGDLSITNPLFLGDQFLRFAYMVFDMDNRQIGIAQAKWGSDSDSNLLAISDTVPSATTAPNYDSVTGFHTSYTVHSLASLS